MTTNTNNTNNPATIENRELTNDELNAVSGGAAVDYFIRAADGADAGKTPLNPSSVARIDASSPNLF